MRLLRGLLLKPPLNLLSWILRHKDGNSLILGGPLGWTWQATLDATHHGALAGPANAHRHGDLADIGIDDHHARDHATRHQNGGADEMSVAGLSGELADNQPPKAHESTHVAGGSDDIDSALAIAAMANLTQNKAWKGNASNRPAEVDWPVGAPSGLIGIWHGTIANIPAGWVICDGNNGTPNMLGRFVEGVATAATDPGATGGEATHTLSIAEMPAHTHSGILTGGIDYWVGEYSGISYGSTNSTGGGGSHQNKPPYYDVAFLMKT